MRREQTVAIILRGHEERHAVVSSLCMHLPDYAPVPADGQALCLSALDADGLTARCRLTVEGRNYVGTARWERDLHGRVLPDRTTDDLARRRRWLVGLSVYRAACACTGRPSPWGALSGVRPAKVAAAMLRRGLSEDETALCLQDTYGLRQDKAALCTGAARCSHDLQVTLNSRDCALYVGIPFCPTVCGYCSFVSRKATAEALGDYCSALLAELSALGEGLSSAGYRVRSVYVGGGTPTVLSASALTELLSCLAQCVDLSDCSELTVEAGRPDTVTSDRLAALAAGGVSRICINPQTLDDDLLSSIGRRHTAQDFFRAYALARQSGDWEINCDLIAGLPAQQPEGFLDDLSRIIDLSPDQITVHSLALKNASRMTEQGQSLSTRLDGMLTRGAQALYAAGYAPYYLYRQKFSGGGENCGWMKEGRKNAYNILMMEELCSVFAVGAGAVSKCLRTGGLDRMTNPKYPDEYRTRIASICEHKRRLPSPL